MASINAKTRKQKAFTMPMYVLTNKEKINNPNNYQSYAAANNNGAYVMSNGYWGIMISKLKKPKSPNKNKPKSPRTPTRSPNTPKTPTRSPNKPKSPRTPKTPVYYNLRGARINGNRSINGKITTINPTAAFLKVNTNTNLKKYTMLNGSNAVSVRNIKNKNS
jgi:hypothetical protein